MVLAGALGVVIAGDAAVREPLPAGRQTVMAHPAQSTEQRVLQDGSDWLSDAFWVRKRAKGLQERWQYGYLSPESNPFSNNETGSRPHERQSARERGHYRTVCVRLCDGYYFPISFSTTWDRFARDEQICQSKCASETRLFYHSSNDPNAETLKDRDGNPYEDLVNAFVYRTEYKPSCQCRPQPWTDEARQRHAIYATEEWQQKAVRTARAMAREASERKPWRIVPPAADISGTSELETAAVPDEAPTLSGEQPFGVNVVRPNRSERMGLGGARRAAEQVRPRVIRRRDRSWRQGVFHNID